MRNQKEVERRVKILTFREAHGERATTDAFGVSRRTLYRWQSALTEGKGKLPALDPKSTAPKDRRKRVYDPAYLEAVLTLRREHHRIGKKKIAALLHVSESYAGRTLSNLKTRGLLPQYRHVSLSGKTGRMIERNPVYRKKIRRPKQKRGIEIDTIVRFIDGMKRYVYTAIDVERKFAFAGGYTNHSSTSAADFLEKLREVAPFSITEIQSDNGSEFAHLFRDACATLRITHYHTYPHSPKMNAHIERFNRTLSEDCIMRHRSVLRDDLLKFNTLLVDWLLWYNMERPHESLGMRSPMQYIVSTLSAEECQRWWTRTLY
jgi:transposase InsO family protein